MIDDAERQAQQRDRGGARARRPDRRRAPARARRRARPTQLRASAAAAEPAVGRERGRARPSEAEPSGPSPLERVEAGARLLATQMAVSGTSREEIETRLRNGFEIEDTDAILDAILGPEE